jgi:hypothetical protein
MDAVSPVEGAVVVCLGLVALDVGAVFECVGDLGEHRGDVGPAWLTFGAPVLVLPSYDASVQRAGAQVDEQVVAVPVVRDGAAR